MKQSKLLNNVLRKMLLLLIAPAALLTGCATPSIPSAPASPALPPPPSLREPIQQQSFSERARLNIRTWQQRLTGSTPTGKL